MKKLLAVAVLTVLGLTGAILVSNLSVQHSQVQTANGGGTPPWPQG